MWRSSSMKSSGLVLRISVLLGGARHRRIDHHVHAGLGAADTTRSQPVGPCDARPFARRPRDHVLHARGRSGLPRSARSAGTAGRSRSCPSRTKSSVAPTSTIRPTPADVRSAARGWRHASARREAPPPRARSRDRFPTARRARDAPRRFRPSARGIRRRGFRARPRPLREQLARRFCRLADHMIVADEHRDAVPAGVVCSSCASAKSGPQAGFSTSTAFGLSATAASASGMWLSGGVPMQIRS